MADTLRDTTAQEHYVVHVYDDTGVMYPAHDGSPMMLFGGGCAFSTGPEHHGGIPLSIPRDQLYFWTAKWQAEEAAAAAEIGRGDTRVFDNGSDAVRWLLDPDD